MSGANLKPGEIEYEFGIPIPGTILPQDQWARTAIKRLPDAGPIDWNSVFGRRAPLVVDLGCGNGRFLLASAVARPTHDHVGVDGLPVVIRYATRRANQRGLHNARLIVCGAYQFLHQHLADASVAEIHIYHPQPFHDDTEVHRRLLAPSFLLLAHRKLEANGRLFLQTDDRSYWHYLRTVMPALFRFQEIDGEWPEEPRLRSRRELIAAEKGLTVFRGVGTTAPDHSQEELERIVQALPLPTFATNRGRARRFRSRRPRR